MPAAVSRACSRNHRATWNAEWTAQLVEDAGHVALDRALGDGTGVPPPGHWWPPRRRARPRPARGATSGPSDGSGARTATWPDWWPDLANTCSPRSRRALCMARPAPYAVSKAVGPRAARASASARSWSARKGSRIGEPGSNLRIASAPPRIVAARALEPRAIAIDASASRPDASPTRSPSAPLSFRLRRRELLRLDQLSAPQTEECTVPTMAGAIPDLRRAPRSGRSHRGPLRSVIDPIGVGVSGHEHDLR